MVGTGVKKGGNKGGLRRIEERSSSRDVLVRWLAVDRFSDVSVVDIIVFVGDTLKNYDGIILKRQPQAFS